MKLIFSDRSLDKPAPLVMGILNVTPDSFSDGGKFLKPSDAVDRAMAMADAGADIIDVGGESTRPGADPVAEEEETTRVIAVIERIKKARNIRVSIDTYKEGVARKAVQDAGADMINDISALRFGDGMADTAARLRVPVVLMHIRGHPKIMQESPRYDDVILEIRGYFEERIEFALSRGIAREKIILDPGIGFGKRLEDNIAIIRRLGMFQDFDLPLMVGVSRKSFLKAIAGEADAEKRLGETLTAQIAAILNGASIIRTHDVKETVASIKTMKALL